MPHFMLPRKCLPPSTPRNLLKNPPKNQSLANNMRHTRLLRAGISLILFISASGASLFAQQPSGETNLPASPAPVAKISAAGEPHRFWDRENDWLFAGVGASRDPRSDGRSE